MAERFVFVVEAAYAVVEAMKFCSAGQYRAYLFVAEEGMQFSHVRCVMCHVTLKLYCLQFAVLSEVYTSAGPNTEYQGPGQGLCATSAKDPRDALHPSLYYSATSSSAKHTKQHVFSCRARPTHSPGPLVSTCGMGQRRRPP